MFFKNKVTNLVENTLYFNILYLIFSLCFTMPYIRIYISKYFKVLIIYGAVIIIYHFFKRKLILKNRYFIWIFLFIFFVGLSTLINYKIFLIFNIKLYAYLIIQFFVIAQVYNDEEKSKKHFFIINNISILIISIIGIISFLMFVFGINGSYTILSGKDLLETYYYGVAFNNRLTGIVGNPNMLGILMLLSIGSIFTNLCIFVVSNKIKMLYIIFGTANFICFIMSSSRGAEMGALGFFMVLIYFFIKTKIKNKSRYFLKNIVCIFLSGTLVFLGLSLFPIIRKGLGYLPSTIQLIFTVANEKDNIPQNDSIPLRNFLNEFHVELERSDVQSESFGNGRLFLWKAGTKIVKNHLLFGVGKTGLPEYMKKYNPDSPLPGIEGGGMHNILYQILVCYGIFALVVFFLFIFILVRDGCNVMFKTPLIHDYKLLSTLFAIMALLFANNMVEANVLFLTNYMNFYFMLYLGYLMFYLQKNLNGENNRWTTVMEKWKFKRKF